MIELCHVHKSFGNTTPVTDVSTTIRDGEVVAVIGPSGCGKSTFLKLINLLEKPTSGKILVDGEDITAPDYKAYQITRKIGMVFQSFNLFGHLTAVENVMIPQMDLLGRAKQEAYDKAMSLLRMVGMDSRAMEYPAVLSGGQKQRVAIARTLALSPEVILFDEPTSALDPTMVGEVQAVIRRLAEMGTTIVIVTHEMRFAREISTRVIYWDQGTIYEEGTPEQIFENPQKPLTQRFIRQLKVYEKVIQRSSFNFDEVIRELELFGLKNRFEKSRTYIIQSVFEELCRQILLTHNPDYRIRFTVEYSDTNDTVEIKVAYNGDLFPPEETDDLVSLAILRNKVKSMTYSQKPGVDERNQILIHI